MTEKDVDIRENNDEFIEWRPINDGHGIVGYAWTCPHCENEEAFGEYWADEVECEECGRKFKNVNKPK